MTLFAPTCGAALGCGPSGVILQWSPTSTPVESWLIIRNETIIGEVLNDPAVEKLYSFIDPGTGGDYEVLSGEQSGFVSIHCPLLTRQRL